MARNNIIAKLQHWMDSKPGQMFLNYAYSWGASIVILGALFKITHIDGADFMLFLGMGTEVIVFFLAGFERPYDVDDKKEKTTQEAVQTNGEPIIAGGGGGGTVFLGGGMPAGMPVAAEGEVSAEGTVTAGGDVPAGGTVAAGADGLEIEVHCHPEKALSDASQQLTPDQFEALCQKLGKYAAVEGKTL